VARRKKTLAEEALSGPAYLVSFAATMTIMLAFFIILCSFAREQDEGLFHAGTGSFIRVLNSFGLPGLFGGRAGPVGSGARNLRYRGHTRRYAHGPVADQELADAQAILDRLRRTFEVTRRPPERAGTRLWGPGVFAPGTDRFRPEGHEFLDGLAGSVEAADAAISIVAFARRADDADNQTAWRLAARRAGAVTRRLRERLGSAVRIERAEGRLLDANRPGGEEDNVLLVVRAARATATRRTR
jgi:flagellar motor protein MotB